MDPGQGGGELARDHAGGDGAWYRELPEVTDHAAPGAFAAHEQHSEHGSGAARLGAFALDEGTVGAPEVVGRARAASVHHPAVPVGGTGRVATGDEVRWSGGGSRLGHAGAI